MPKDPYEMDESELRSRIVTLAFGGDERLFIAFVILDEGPGDGRAEGCLPRLQRRWTCARAWQYASIPTSS